MAEDTTWSAMSRSLILEFCDPPRQIGEGPVPIELVPFHDDPDGLTNPPDGWSCPRPGSPRAWPCPTRAPRARRTCGRRAGRRVDLIGLGGVKGEPARADRDGHHRMGGLPRPFRAEGRRRRAQQRAIGPGCAQMMAQESHGGAMTSSGTIRCWVSGRGLSRGWNYRAGRWVGVWCHPPRGPSMVSRTAPPRLHQVHPLDGMYRLGRG